MSNDSVQINIRHWTNKKDKVCEKLILEAIPWKYEAADKAYAYAKKVLKSRWRPGEKKIIVHPRTSYLYAKNVLKRRWLAAENVLAESKDIEATYHYCKYVMGKRLFPGAENVVSNLTDYWGTNVRFLYLFARDILKKRVKRSAEKQIAKSGYAADYAIHVIKGRWKAAEEHIAKSPAESIKYAEKVLKARWPAAEKVILKDYSWDIAQHIVEYATKVFKKRWAGGETILINNIRSMYHLDDYMKVLTPAEKAVFKNKIMFKAMESEKGYAQNTCQQWVKKEEETKVKIESSPLSEAV